MIENTKTEIVEEDAESEELDKRFFKAGPIVIGVILTLMVICIIMIIGFEKFWIFE